MPVERTAYTNAPSNRRSLANTACQRSVGLMVENLARAPPEFYPICALKSSLPRLILGRAVDRRHLPARHPEIDGELAAVVDHVVQHQPEEILAAHVAHLLRHCIELDRRAQVAVVRLADRIGHLLEHTLDLADRIRPRRLPIRSARRRKLELALERLRRGHTLERKRPRQLLGRATGGVGLHGFFPAGVGAQDLYRRRCLPLPGVEKRLFLAHVLSSLVVLEICHNGRRLRVVGNCYTVLVHWHARPPACFTVSIPAVPFLCMSRSPSACGWRSRSARWAARLRCHPSDNSPPSCGSIPRRSFRPIKTSRHRASSKFAMGRGRLSASSRRGGARGNAPSRPARSFASCSRRRAAPAFRRRSCNVPS